ncbi:MAG: hypothetical protein AAGA73_09750 [Pseudomonadota bacterium]
MLIRDLRSDLLAFDGKNVTVLSKIAVRYGDRLDYVDGLLATADDPEGHRSDGATWLIKAYLDAGGELTKPQFEMLVSKLGALKTWASQLHVCQLVRHLRPNEQQANTIVRWLIPILAHDRPFLRAWSLDALCHASAQHSAYADRAMESLNAAMEDPAASVRARARNLRKSHPALCKSTSDEVNTRP